MRLVATIAVMLALIASVLASLALASLELTAAARAEEPRYAPPAGARLTYRMVSHTTMSGGEELTFGDVHRIAVTASDGRIADGAVTPLAILRGCPDSQTSKDCRQARNFANIVRDGDLITVPVPDAIGAAIAKIAKVHSRDIVEVTQTVPILGAKDIEEIDKPEIGEAPLFLLVTVMQCDERVLDGFFPLGQVATVSIPCKSTIERTQSRLPMAKDFKTTSDVTYQLTFAGRHRITVPAGEFETATIKFKVDSGGKGPDVEGQTEIIEALGVSASLTTTVRPVNSTNVARNERLLTKVER